MNFLLVLPIVIPLASAAVGLLTWRRRRWQRALALASSAALFGAGLALTAALWWGDQVLASQVGNWPAPYGITLVADLFAALMVAVTGLIGVAVTIYSVGSIDSRREAYGYYPLLQILLMGVCGAFLTGDLFNLYVWFEVMLMASFVLLALGGERNQLRGAITYVTMNLVASAIFLAAVGILYGVVGTLNMAHLGQRLNDPALQPGLSSTLAMMFLSAFGIKAAVFPLFFWLPASYHTPPVAVSAVFAGLLTKVGVYALIRVFTLLFVQDTAYTHGLLLVIAGLTMITGVLGAAAQHEFRRVLSFHIISQIGYMLMGLALFGLAADPQTRTFALMGSIFYIIHHIIVKTNLFLVSGAAYRAAGTFELKDLGGLYEGRPALAFLFLVPALSLSGMPPLSGFFAKLALVQAGLAMGQYVIVAVALGVGLLTLFSMTKIWAEAFWKPAEAVSDPAASLAAKGTSRLQPLYPPMVFLAACTAAIGLAAEPLLQAAHRAAAQLMDRQAYITAVLGATP